jgi:protein-tyrosine phosphatase
MNEGMENLKQIEELEGVQVITNKIVDNLEQDKRNLYKIADKLENRIATLEKVLQSHAKCIGELREDKKDDL